MKKIIQMVKEAFCSYHTYTTDEEYWEDKYKLIKRQHCSKCGHKRIYIYADYTEERWIK